jgi:polyphosphate kinase
MSKNSSSGFTAEDFANVKTRDELLKLSHIRGVNLRKAEWNLRYEEELKEVQAQLVTLQQYIQKKRLRVAVLFEGRDAAGKGGAIKRFTQHLNPRTMHLVALPKPTEVERGQWYFRRYLKHMPNPGEIAFFDRSWYNRAVVEPVMGFCSKSEYKAFMNQVPEFEHLLYEDGVKVIKFWFSISKKEQLRRFNKRLDDPLKRWKFSPVDEKGQELWDTYTYYKEQMFSRTHTPFCPWVIVEANSKRRARLESIRYVLSQFEYPGKAKTKAIILPDPNKVTRYYRGMEQTDV